MFSYKTPRTPKQWLSVVLFGIILLYIAIAAYKLRFPGTQYDEALYLNSALGGIDQKTFITKTFHGFPVLLMPYIGALKAWLFYPIFAVFGVTPITMRLPLLFITGLALYLLYRLLSTEIGQKLSLLIVALTALDASFIMFTRLDNGPVVLDFLIKVGGLALLLRYARTKRLVWLSGFWAAMLLGTFNKLNFIWYVNAFAGAFVLIYGIKIWQSLKSSRERWQLLAVSTIGYAASVAYYLYISISYHLGGSLGFVGWQTFYNTLSSMVDGDWFYNYALSINKVGSVIVFWFIMAVVFLGIARLLQLLKNKPKKLPPYTRFYGFMILTFTFLIIELAMTRKATAGWHYFSLYPFIGVLFVLAAAFIGETTKSLKKYASFTILSVLVAVLCCYQLVVYREYTLTYTKTVSNFGWSSSIYQLIDFAKAHHQQFVSIDWGTQTQLIGADPVANKYYELFGPVPTGNSVAADQDFQTYITTKPNAFYIAHPADLAVFPEVRKDFFKLAKEHGYTAVKTIDIKDGSKTIFEIYQLQH